MWGRCWDAAAVPRKPLARGRWQLWRPSTNGSEMKAKTPHRESETEGKFKIQSKVKLALVIEDPTASNLTIAAVVEPSST